MTPRSERKVIREAWNGLNGSRSNIQFRSKRTTEWFSYTVSGPNWKWRHYDYRIKPQTS